MKKLSYQKDKALKLTAFVQAVKASNVYQLKQVEIKQIHDQVQVYSWNKEANTYYQNFMHIELAIIADVIGLSSAIRFDDDLIPHVTLSYLIVH